MDFETQMCQKSDKCQSTAATLYRILNNIDYI